MADERVVVTRQSPGDPLRCFLAGWPVAPGDLVVGPDGAPTLVIATEDQLVQPIPAAEGRVRPAPVPDRSVAPEAALGIVPPAPYLNSVVHTTDGPARLVRIRARGQVAMLRLPSGETVERPLADLVGTAAPVASEEDPA